MILSVDQRLEVVGLAQSGEDAVRLADELEPDIVLMDLSMPGIGGVEATKRIRAARPAARVLIVTGSDAGQDVDAARSPGAVAYVTKDRIAAELIGAIVDVAA